MKVCPNKKCGATDIAPDARYCPHCRKRFPYAKDVRVMEIDKWNSLKAKKQPSSGNIHIDRDEYNRIVNSYNNMVRNGYAPSDKELITDSELQQLRKNSSELDRWKRECANKRNTPIYDYEDEYTHDFYWGNALLVLAIIIPLVFLGWVGLKNTEKENKKSKKNVEIVLDEKTGKYGIMNHAIDSLVTPCVYDTIKHLTYNSFNYYQLIYDGKLGIADSAGYRTIGSQLDTIVHRSDLAITYKDNLQGVISHTGQPILDTHFFSVLHNSRPHFDGPTPGNYVGNIIQTQEHKDDKWELYNRQGQKICNEKYSFVSQVCHPDLIKVSNEQYNNWGLVDLNGKVILPLEYYDILMFHEDKTWIRKWNPKTREPFVCLSSDGKLLGTMPTGYDPIEGFSCGLTPVRNTKAPYNSDIGYCNSKGEIVIPAKYGYYHTSSGSISCPSPSFRGDSALVSLDGKNGILRKDGTFEARE